MKTKDLEAALPDWLKLDNVMMGKGGVVTRALAHSARDESKRCMSVIFDSKGRAYTRMFVVVEDVPNEILSHNPGDGRKVVYVNGFKYVRDESMDLDVS